MMVRSMKQELPTLQEFGEIPLGDAYNQHAIRFNELNAMGYPVGLETVARPDHAIFVNSLLGPELRRRWTQHKDADITCYGNKWAMPTVYNHEFDMFLGMESLGFEDRDDEISAIFAEQYAPLFNSDADYRTAQEMSLNHPIRLVGAVGEYCIRSFMNYEKRIAEDIDPYTQGDVNVQALASASFMTLIRRYERRSAARDPFIAPLDEEVRDRYLKMQHDGVQSMTTAILRKIVRDFYIGIEQRSDLFKQFKNK